MKKYIVIMAILLSACGKMPQESMTIEEMPAASQPASQPTAQSESPVYVGCFSDQSIRALPNWLINSGATLATCVAAAQAQGYLFAGLQYGGQCFAGNIVGYNLLPSTSCNMPCSADSSEVCGGTWANSVYFVGN